MKRFKALNFEYDDAMGTGTALDIFEDADGEFVKYDDAKQQIEWLYESLKNLMRAVKTYSEKTDNNFACGEMSEAERTLRSLTIDVYIFNKKRTIK